jgi:hypothetical protein
MTTKQIPALAFGGIMILFLALGAKFLLQSMSVIEDIPLMPGASGRISFFQRSEVKELDVKSTKVDVYSINVYMFSEDKFSQPETSDYTMPVERQTSRKDIATYAVEQIIRGPTIDEIEGGLRPTFGIDHFVTISGKSVCGIKNFTLELDVDNYFAKVRFCKDIRLNEEMSGPLLAEQIRKTLIRFEKIHKVQILNKDQACFDGSSILSPDDCVF